MKGQTLVEFMGVVFGFSALVAVMIHFFYTFWMRTHCSFTAFKRARDAVEDRPITESGIITQTNCATEKMRVFIPEIHHVPQ